MAESEITPQADMPFPPERADIGGAIRRMHYRIWYRGGAVRVQYSFGGKRWSDFREFQLTHPERKLKIGLYACSPGNSYFDCTFSGMTLEEDEIL